MKSINELEKLLVSELWDSLDSVRHSEGRPDYYNELMGNTSGLLAAILDSWLKNKDKDWASSGKWMDDSLLTDVELDNNHIEIRGVMISGKGGITEQWTDPFYFEIDLNPAESASNEYVFLFGDRDKPGVSYDTFRFNRDAWNGKETKWKYVINSGEI